MSRSHKRKRHTTYGNYKHSDLKKSQQRNNYRPVQKPTISSELSQEITKDRTPVTKRNGDGDVVYNMQYIGYEKFEYWVDYDQSRRPIKYQDSRGAMWFCKYNSKGNICDYWDSTGYSEVYKYYANNLVICTTSFGEKIKKKVVTNKYITRDIFISSDDYI